MEIARECALETECVNINGRPLYLEGTKYIFRLYFVDCPESQSDSQVASRIADQAEYFGITPDQSVQLGKEATNFSLEQLSGTFTVYTRFRKALGRSKLPRYYAMVVIDKEDLGELLAKNGLARIYGVRTPLPDGSTSRNYLQKLKNLEAQAKAKGEGGWKP